MSVNSEAIFDILDNQVTFYFNRDCDSDVYVEFEGPRGAICFESVDGRLFQSFLRIAYRGKTDGEICSNFGEYIQAACDDALWSEKPNMVSICHRVSGGLHKKIVYSLSNTSNYAVVVEPGKWKVCSESALKKIKFLKSKSSLPQVKPVRGGDYLKLLRPYINLDDDNFKLLAVWIIQCLSKTSSHFGLVISGSQGTGKSTLTWLLQDMIDPAITNRSLLPGNERDLKVQLSNSYMVCYDNTKVLKDSVSDTLCSAITGGTVVFRELFTTHDQVALPLHNVIGFNGIDIIPPQSDLAERCLLFEPRKIHTDRRQTDNDFKAKFRKDKPAILGGMFEALCQAMEILPTLQDGNLHRMAQAHKEMKAIAMALEIEQEEFDRIFWANVNQLKKANLASDPFVEAMINYLQHRPNEDRLTMSKLLDAMRKDFKNRSCDTYLSSLPKSASQFSQSLAKAEVSLFEAGYKFHTERKSDATYITINQIAPSRLNKKQREAAERQKALMANDDAATEE